MYCPFCNNLATQVKDSRNCKTNVIRRRRLCFNCKKKFTTFERVHISKLYVIKKSGVRKLFDRSKLIESVTTATRKRSISNHQIEQLIDEVLESLNIFHLMEIPSSVLGKSVMIALSNCDHVSCIRFASVYMDFSSVADFTKFINNIEKQKIINE